MDKRAELIFWGPLCAAAVLLVGVAIFSGTTDFCTSEVGLATMKQDGAASCFDYWLNRYQTLITSGASAAVALWAAVKLIKQIELTAESNRTTQELLRVEISRDKREWRAHKGEFFVLISKLPKLAQLARDEILSKSGSDEHQRELGRATERFRYLGNLLFDHEDDLRLLEGCLNHIEIYTPNEEYTRNLLSQSEDGRRRLDLRLHDAAYSFFHHALPVLKERAFETLGS